MAEQMDYDDIINRLIKGGLGAPVNLSPTDNLDDLLTDNHYTATPDVASQARGYPIDSLGGHLLTWSRNTSGFQEFWPVSSLSNGNLFYRRTRVAGTWQLWKAFGKQRTDMSAGRAIYLWDTAYNRDQLIYGDTGVRKLANPAAISSGDLLIRRTDGNVYFRANAITFAAAATDLSLANLFPVGFRAPGNQVIPSVPYVAGEVEVSARTTGANLQIKSVAAGAVTNLVGTWDTNEPWPASLPGSASGSLPA